MEQKLALSENLNLPKKKLKIHKNTNTNTKSTNLRFTKILTTQKLRKFQTSPLCIHGLLEVSILLAAFPFSILNITLTKLFFHFPRTSIHQKIQNQIQGAKVGTAATALKKEFFDRPISNYNKEITAISSYCGK